MEYGRCADDGTNYDHEKQTAGSNDEFQKEYAERYDWLVTLFKDWAFTFMSSFLYYQTLTCWIIYKNSFYRQGNGGIWRYCTNYHIELLERPTICLGFFISLLLGMQIDVFLLLLL